MNRKIFIALSSPVFEFSRSYSSPVSGTYQTSEEIHCRKGYGLVFPRRRFDRRQLGSESSSVSEPESLKSQFKNS